MRRALYLAAAIASPALAQQREAWEPPTLSITRYDEDWSDLADSDKRAHHWTGPFKYIPVADDAYLVTGLELRTRNENYLSPDWGGTPDDSYLWLRAIPYADLHVGRVRAFVQPIAAYAVGVAPKAGPIDQTRVDLLQGFVDASHAVGGVDLTVRAGRQMVSLGSERLIGTRYGPNVPLAFDGFRGIASVGTVTISLLALKPVTPGLGSFDDHRSRTKSLWGIYGSRPNLELYYLGYRNTAATFGGASGSELRHSIGARWFGTMRSWHWNVESVGQFGTFASQAIRAWTIAVEGGRSFPTAPLKPDATVRFNVVSGDGKAGDRTLGTFDAMFPKGKYFGELSPVGPTNIVSLNPRVGVTLGGGFSASLAVMGYWRQSRGDGVYDIPGNLLRGPGTSGARFIGKEAETTIAWQATPELELSASASAFAPGGFIRDTGSGRTIGMIGLESNFRF